MSGAEACDDLLDVEQEEVRRPDDSINQLSVFLLAVSDPSFKVCQLQIVSSEIEIKRISPTCAAALYGATMNGTECWFNNDWKYLVTFPTG